MSSESQNRHSQENWVLPVGEILTDTVPEPGLVTRLLSASEIAAHGWEIAAPNGHMGEVPVPVAEIYHPVEGGNGEIGFYLVTDGSRTPYRLHFRRPCFIYYQAYPEMIKGAMLSDAIVILSSLNVIAGELDA